MPSVTTICYLCYSRETPFILTCSSRSTEACLPVCSKCIPPWIDCGDDGWWYEKREADGSHSRPTPDEIEKAFGDRYDSIYIEHELDTQVQEQSEKRNYRDKFRIDDLLGHWNDETRQYNFPGKRPVWIKQLNSYLLL